MRNMLKTLAEKLSAGEDIVMVTIIASSGSTPRGTGARMLIGREGRICGTIGGGAVEYRSEHIAAEVLIEKKSGVHDFSLTKDDVQNLGMICGGAVNVFFSYIPAGDEHTIEVCREAEKQFAAGKDMWLVSNITDGGTLGVYAYASGAFGFDCSRAIMTHFTRHPERFVWEGTEWYVEQVNSSGKVYVFGCGHVAQELVPVLSHVGFSCVALDDRPDYADRNLFPDADDVRMIDFNNIFDTVSITEEDYVCIMTRGHAFDAVVQAQVLMNSRPYYIGVIGSAKKKAGVYKMLSEQYGIAPEEFERITSPIGLYIKAETPAEIAISIAGQMIERRAERNRQ